MANTFGADILIQANEPLAVAAFYVEELGFTITAATPTMVSLHGPHINLFIERGPELGPVLEVTVADIDETTRRLVAAGSAVVKDEPAVPRRYVMDPYGLLYNLRAKAPAAD
jgi:hypothetical protein